MLPMSCYISDMARGPSGRIIVEMEPSLKRALHARLAAEGRSLKDWFLERAEAYLDPPQQSLSLQLGEPPSPTYVVKSDQARSRQEAKDER